MVNTRAQASLSTQSREDEMNYYDDNSSDISLSEFGTRTFEIEINTKNYGEQDRDNERIPIERSFSEMIGQIGELTSLVRTLTEQFPRVTEKRMAITHRKIDLQAILTREDPLGLLKLQFVTKYQKD